MIVHAVTDFLFADATKVWYIMFPIAASVVQRLLRLIRPTSLTNSKKLEGKYYQTLVAAVRWNTGTTGTVEREPGVAGGEPLQNAAGVILFCNISVRHFRFVSSSICCRSP